MHITNLLAHFSQFNLIQGFFINKDFACSWLVEALDQLDNSAFARARWAHDSCGLAHLKFTVELPQDLLILASWIEEIDMVERDLASKHMRDSCPRILVDIRLAVDDIERKFTSSFAFCDGNEARASSS